MRYELRIAAYDSPDGIVIQWTMWDVTEKLLSTEPMVSGAVTSGGTRPDVPSQWLQEVLDCVSHFGVENPPVDE
jgi:hypothetical protein